MMDICTDWKAHLLVEYSKKKFACELLDGQVVEDINRVLDDVIFYKDRIVMFPSHYARNITVLVSFKTFLVVVFCQILCL
jgi:hypothetical protein